jgi:hypothetical protein
MIDAGAEIIDSALSSSSGVYLHGLAEDVFLAMVRVSQHQWHPAWTASKPQAVFLEARFDMHRRAE